MIWSLWTIIYGHQHVRFMQKNPSKNKFWSSYRTMKHYDYWRTHLSIQIFQKSKSSENWSNYSFRFCCVFLERKGLNSEIIRRVQNSGQEFLAENFQVSPKESHSFPLNFAKFTNSLKHLIIFRHRIIFYLLYDLKQSTLK